MPIPFVKYSGCGNDFIIIDNRTLNLSLSRETITNLCHRQLGIGADGIILLEISHLKNASYRMRIFNADGTEAEMCGNGLRCLAKHIRSLNPKESEFIVETMHQEMKISFTKDLINISMPIPQSAFQKELSINQKKFNLHCIDTGVPHTVIFVEDIEKDDLFTPAKAIRFHPDFSPKGTNVNFAQILADKSIAVRTYERGVEEETLACGTGATAVAIIAADIHRIPTPIKIRTRSNDWLSISFQGNSHHLKDLIMTGPAVKIFEGSIDIQD